MNGVTTIIESERKGLDSTQSCPHSLTFCSSITQDSYLRPPEPFLRSIFLERFSSLVKEPVVLYSISLMTLIRAWSSSRLETFLHMSPWCEVRSYTLCIVGSLNEEAIKSWKEGGKWWWGPGSTFLPRKGREREKMCFRVVLRNLVQVGLDKRET